MTQYCQNCGSRLNGGEAYCPRCQKPVANKNDAPVSPPSPTPSPKQDGIVTRKANIGRIVLIVAVFLAVSSGIGYAIGHSKRSQSRVVLESRKIDKEADDLVRHKAYQSPAYAAEWGWRLLLNSFDGDVDVVPIAEYQQAIDEAGEIILKASEEAAQGNDKVAIFHSQRLLTKWRLLVTTQPAIPSRYWNDMEFRRRVDYFF